MTKLTDKQQKEEIQGVTQKIQGLLGIKIDLSGTIWRLQRIRRKECKKNELLYDSMERRQPRLARANERTVN